MEYDISQQEIDELIKTAQSAKLLPPEERCFDGCKDPKRESDTFAYTVLQKLGIEVEVDKDF